MERISHHAAAAVTITLLGLLAGCATTPGARHWGQDATLTPGWQRLGRSAAHAALDPQTWAPVAAAALLQVEDMDARLSDWAVEHTPIFGAPATASRASDDLWRAGVYSYVLTALATPSGQDTGEWVLNKSKGFAAGGTAYGLTVEVVDLLKRSTHRTRPDGSNNLSFPSGHASSSAVLTTLAARNVTSIPVAPALRTALQLACRATAAGCAWARVEGRHHYPSDVLVGLALGHFLGAFIHDAFLGSPASRKTTVRITAERGGIAIQLSLDLDRGSRSTLQPRR